MIDIKKNLLYQNVDYIGRIDLNKAQSFENNQSTKHNHQDFYKHSGLEHFIDTIKKMLHNEKFPLNAIFIENSTISTSIEKGVLSAFTAYWKKDNTYEEAHKVVNAQFNVISYLQEQHLNLFWHPNFFISPLDSIAFSSIYNVENKVANEIIIEYERRSALNSNFLEPILVESTDKGDRIFVFNNKLKMDYSEILSINSKHLKNKSLEELHNINHILYHRSFLSETDNHLNNPSVFLSIPIICPYASGISHIDDLDSSGRFTGLGAVFIFLWLEKPLKDDQRQYLFKVLEDLINEIFAKSKDFASFYSFLTAFLKAEDTKQFATTSAISQIFARNMSHNIGSHVSYRATNGQVKKRAKELFKAIKTNDADFATWLDYFSEKLDKYEIYRNEYLADFDQSPKFVRFYQDLILPFCENMLVMDNIAAGESLHYKSIYNNKLKIRCYIDGKEIKAHYPNLTCMIANMNCPQDISYPDNFPYLLKNKGYDANNPEKYSLEAAINNKQIKWVEDNATAEDVEICVHSEQAIYSILENFIRNSAKHKPKGSGDELIIYLDLRTNTEDTYTLYIYDNSSELEKQFLYNEDTHKAGLYQRINESLLEESGKPRRANWGFADMKINSFLLLNKVDAIEDTQLPKNFDLVVMDDKHNFSTVSKENIKELKDGEKYRFGYKIKLSIARKVLWVGKFEGDNQQQLEKQGLVVIKSLEELRKSKETVRKIKDEDKGLVAFQFVVINEPITEEEYLSIEEKLPGRIIAFQNKGEYTIGEKTRIVKADGSTMPKDSIVDMLKWCWQQWLIERNTSIDMYSYFENESVANEWSEVPLSKDLNSIIINKIDEPKELKDNRVNIVYNHHGGAFNSGKIVCAQNSDGDEMLNFSTDHSLIFFDKGSEDFSLLNYPPQHTDDKELLMYQLMDAATTNVFIIDERISEYACNDIPSEFRTNGVLIGTEQLQRTNWNMYATGKLFVIQEIKNGDIACNVGNADEKLTLDISGDTIHLSSDIENFGAIKDIRKDVLIVHRTYLDNAKIGVEPEVFLDKAKKQFGSVFITSGGGYPHNLKTNCKFIPFSVLESCINARLSKNKLNSLIKSNIR